MKKLALFIVPAMLFAACGNDDSITTDINVTDVYNKGGFFIATKTEDGTEWAMQTKSLDADLDQSRNFMEMPQQNYTWVFAENTAVGMVYQQQSAGVGHAFRWQGDGSQFATLGEFRIDSRFSNYGFFDGQLVTSITGQAYTNEQGEAKNDGATFCFWNVSGDNVTLDRKQTISTESITGNDQQVTFSSIVDQGDGTFLTAMVLSSFKQTSAGNGSSIGEVKYPDSVWVARMDKNLNVVKVYGDNRISYAAGQYRSQVLRSVWPAEDGYTYVFSNAMNAATKHKAGALRIKKGADGFDKDYYFDLETPADGYKFRRVWHMTGSKFLLEIYNEKTVTSLTPGHQFAIVDMQSQSFKWLSGVPTKDVIVSGNENGSVPMFYGGNIYVPITERGGHAALYKVNPDTGVSTKVLTIKGALEIRTIGFIGK